MKITSHTIGFRIDLSHDISILFLITTCYIKRYAAISFLVLLEPCFRVPFCNLLILIFVYVLCQLTLRDGLISRIIIVWLSHIIFMLFFKDSTVYIIRILFVLSHVPAPQSVNVLRYHGIRYSVSSLNRFTLPYILHLILLSPLDLDLYLP